eukprot:1160268-Pelagomonas_calceolata.AAC.2
MPERPAQFGCPISFAVPTAAPVLKVQDLETKKEFWLDNPYSELEGAHAAHGLAELGHQAWAEEAKKEEGIKPTACRLES